MIFGRVVHGEIIAFYLISQDRKQDVPHTQSVNKVMKFVCCISFAGREE